MVLDAIQDDLRDMALEIRILRDVGQADDNDDLERNTETYIAPKKYKSGTLDFEYNFARKGKFIGLVKARSDEGREYVSRFPFSVGEAGSRDMTVSFLMAGMVAVGPGLWLKRAYDGKKPVH